MRLLLLPILLFATSCRDKDDAPGDNDTEDTTQVDTETSDADGDGSPIDEDCNDNDDSTYPGAPETCDGLDNDCDGEVDENATDATTFYGDSDGDGYGGNTFVVEACEVPLGFVEDASDCNDLDAASHPDADEVCDGADNDCDGYLDEPDAVDASTWYHDTDGDGYGVTTDTDTACDAPRDHVSHDGDCDDTNPAFHPGALEADCTDPNDYNCDGSVGFADADGDGFAACDDCDDTVATANPDGSETCDGIDNDCDGTVDDDASDASTWYADADGDGHGGTQFSVLECAAPAGYVASQDDCDDLDATSYPGASEICDGNDNDCDTEIDEGVGSTWHIDNDSDGYGNGSQSQVACDPPSGFVSNALDCDDFNSATNPGSYEVCDGSDNDCDGTTDEDDAINTITWYADTDADGHGGTASSTAACDQPSNHVSNNTDCNDADATIHPNATEVCDSVDNDCDGSTDEDVTSTFYADGDADGFGDAGTSSEACTVPTGFVADDSDCDDNAITTHPGAAEVCDSVDNDCDGNTDEGVTTSFYTDGDSDGYGVGTAVEACTAPSGFVTDNTDCDDNEFAANPGAAEVCDDIDNDCDGDIDSDDGNVTELCAEGTSCLDIQSSDATATSGFYAIDPINSGTAFMAYCNMDDNGGGWTLSASISASNDNHLSSSAVDSDGNGLVSDDSAGDKLGDTVIDALWTDRIWVRIDSGSGDIHCELSNQTTGFDTWSATGTYTCGYHFSTTTHHPHTDNMNGPAVWQNYDYRAYNNPYSGCFGAAATVVPSGAGGCGHHPSRGGALWIR